MTDEIATTGRSRARSEAGRAQSSLLHDIFVGVRLARDRDPSGWRGIEAARRAGLAAAGIDDAAFRLQEFRFLSACFRCRAREAVRVGTVAELRTRWPVVDRRGRGARVRRGGDRSEEGR